MSSRTAEAVIVGAGVIGASVAFHLARLGIRDLLVLERGLAAGQATGQSGALVRTHYTNAPEARLALASLPWFEEWAERVGGACGFVRTGFAQLVARADAATLVRNVAMLRGIGVETSVVGAAQLAELQPGLVLQPGEAAAYEPRSGYADPLATTLALLQAARQRGARLHEHRTVTGLHAQGGRIRAVETSAGVVEAPLVVLANGAWSKPLAAPLGVDLPIRPVLSQIALFERPADLPRGPAGQLTIIDRANGFYGRADGDDRTLVGLSGLSRDLASPDDGLGSYDAEVPGRARAQANARMPALAASRFLRGRAGPLDVTPDRCAIIGGTPIDGLYLAVGMSGSGFKKAPAIGACLAELIVCGAAATAPIGPFRLERFAEGDLVRGDDYAPLQGLTGVSPH